MQTDRTLAESEQKWIDKYRAALNDTPVAPPRFKAFFQLVHGAKAALLSKIGVNSGAISGAAPPSAKAN